MVKMSPYDIICSKLDSIQTKLMNINYRGRDDNDKNVDVQVDLVLPVVLKLLNTEEFKFKKHIYLCGTDNGERWQVARIEQANVLRGIAQRFDSDDFARSEEEIPPHSSLKITRISEYKTTQEMGEFQKGKHEGSTENNFYKFKIVQGSRGTDFFIASKTSKYNLWRQIMEREVMVVDETIDPQELKIFIDDGRDGRGHDLYFVDANNRIVGMASTPKLVVE